MFWHCFQDDNSTQDIYQTYSETGDRLRPRRRKSAEKLSVRPEPLPPTPQSSVNDPGFESDRKLFPHTVGPMCERKSHRLTGNPQGLQPVPVGSLSSDSLLRPRVDVSNTGTVIQEKGNDFLHNALDLSAKEKELNLTKGTCRPGAAVHVCHGPGQDTSSDLDVSPIHTPKVDQTYIRHSRKFRFYAKSLKLRAVNLYLSLQIRYQKSKEWAPTSQQEATLRIVSGNVNQRVKPVTKVARVFLNSAFSGQLHDKSRKTFRFRVFSWRKLTSVGGFENDSLVNHTIPG